MASTPSKALSSAYVYDVAVIGAGVVGCAIARQVALAGAHSVIVEKAADVLDGASKGNSGILHTGFDAPPDSIEQQCVAAGYREYRRLNERLGLPFLATGAHVIAWSEEEEAKLDALLEKAHANGVTDAVRIGRDALFRAEPRLAPSAFGAIHIPGEGVIDPWSAPHAYLLDAVAAGCTVLRSTRVESGRFDGRTWRIETGQGHIHARHVVNCAGLYGDRVEADLLGETDFTIRPRKGQFVVFDKAATPLINSILLPVPTATSKGVVVTRTAFGNILVGPTAEEQESREDASVDTQTLRSLCEAAGRIVPDLENCDVTATYAGIRPGSDDKAYRIRQEADRRYLRIGGIRSTGLTGALGLASHAIQFLPFETTDEVSPSPEIAPLPNLTEDDRPRRWAEPDNEGIVCHCELVTRSEIKAVMAGPLPPRTLAGLKRRTRVTMGRCQGFYCTGELAEITEGHFDEPLAERTAKKTDLRTEVEK